MTKKEIQDLTLGLSDKGIICFCKADKSGRLHSVRDITPEESALIAGALFKMFRAIHPDDKVMYLPYTNDEYLAITSIDKPHTTPS